MWLDGFGPVKLSMDDLFASYLQVMFRGFRR